MGLNQFWKIHLLKQILTFFINQSSKKNKIIKLFSEINNPSRNRAVQSHLRFSSKPVNIEISINKYYDFKKLFKGENIVVPQTRFYKDMTNLTVNVKTIKMTIKGLKNKEINDLFNREITVYNPKNLAIVKLNDNQISLGSGVGPNNNNLLINKVNIIPGTNTPILLPAP